MMRKEHHSRSILLLWRNFRRMPSWCLSQYGIPTTSPRRVNWLPTVTKNCTALAPVFEIDANRVGGAPQTTHARGQMLLRYTGEMKPGELDSHIAGSRARKIPRFTVVAFAALDNLIVALARNIENLLATIWAWCREALRYRDSSQQCQSREHTEKNAPIRRTMLEGLPRP